MNNSIYKIVSAITAFIVGVITAAVVAVLWPFVLAAFVYNEIEKPNKEEEWL